LQAIHVAGYQVIVETVLLVQGTVMTIASALGTCVALKEIDGTGLKKFQDVHFLPVTHLKPLATIFALNLRV
jgi:hypothetical protein